MNAFQFGRFVRVKLAAGPGLPAPTSSLTGKPSLPSTPSPQLTISGSGLPKPPAAPAAPKPTVPSSFKGGPVGAGGEPTWGNFAYEFGQNFNPWNGRKSQTGYGSYGDVLDRWFNPNTKQQVTEKGEHGLMRGAQIAAGTGAAAGVLAGGIAAAPALGIGAGGGGTTAATAGTGAAAATQTPAGQQFMNRAGQFATQAQQTLGNLSTNYFTRVEPTLNRIGYKPEDLAMDGYAAATGNFDKIKGPSWTGRMSSLNISPSLGLPAGSGAPSVKLPSPADVARSIHGVASSTPGAVRSALGY